MENGLNDNYNEQLDLFHVNLDGFEGPLDLLLSQISSTWSKRN